MSNLEAFVMHGIVFVGIPLVFVGAVNLLAAIFIN